MVQTQHMDAVVPNPWENKGEFVTLPTGEGNKVRKKWWWMKVVDREFVNKGDSKTRPKPSELKSL